MAGVLDSVFGGSAAGSRASEASSKSSADFLDQKTITRNDENPTETITTMMKEMLDIPEYDNDEATINVIQKKGGKNTRQSFGQHQGLLLRLVEPYKNPENKMLKVDLLTVKPGDASKEIERLEAEYKVFVADIAEHFKKLSISNVDQLESHNTANPSIHQPDKIMTELQIIISGYSRGGAGNIDNNIVKKYLKIIQQN